MSGAQLRVLWTDDDPPERYEYESYVLAEEGWEVVWAPDVGTAARSLSEQRFDALILDQMLPYDGLESGDPLWNGCLLLRWLRGKGPPPAVTLDEQGALSRLAPLEANRAIPTVVVSAFHDPNVELAMRDASPMDRQIPLVPKPIDMTALLDFLHAVAASAREGA